MSNIAERIKEERERLGLSQAKLGGIAGVSKQTVITWEKGNTSPTAVQLNEMAENGLDVMYALTGRRTEKHYIREERNASGVYAKSRDVSVHEPLNYRERAVLDCLRKLNPSNQEMLYGIAESMVKTQNLRAAMEKLNSGKGAGSDEGWWPKAPNDDE